MQFPGVIITRPGRLLLRLALLLSLLLSWPLQAAAADQRLVVNLHLVDPPARIFSASGRLAYVPPDVERRIALTREASTSLAGRYGLEVEHEWAIPVLGVYCIVVSLPAGTNGDGLREALGADAAVESVQALNRFTVARQLDAPAVPGAAATSPGNSRSPDSAGEGVGIAVIDTGADLGHPALSAARIESMDLVEPPAGAFPAEEHATSILGVLAARDESTGLVGAVPDASLRLLRACWETGANRPAECNTFTLAKALALLLENPPDIVNLSLSGPRDRLLERLAARLVEQDVILVAAGNSREGFPGSVPGSLLAIEHFDAADKVMTLLPGGRIAMQAGSSMAAARLTAARAQQLHVETRD